MGHVLLSKEVPNLTAPVTGILASTLSVGSSVYLMENGTAVEYLVVNQGIPSGSSLYDASCDGTWLLRKDIYETRAWHSSDVNDYAKSTIHSYLNSDFFNLFGPIEQDISKQVKIPYLKGAGYSGTIASGSNGLICNVFLLSNREIGWTSSTSNVLPDDGACVSYFNGTSVTDTKRIAYFNGTATNWWLRSGYKTTGTNGDRYAHVVTKTGGKNAYTATTSSNGVRPALILPSNALFDKNTLLLKGVA